MTQPKLRLSRPGDALEAEAERVARRVTSGQPAGPITALGANGGAGTAQRDVVDELDEPGQALAQREVVEEPDEGPLQALAQREVVDELDVAVQALAQREVVEEPDDGPLQALAQRDVVDELDEPLQALAQPDVTEEAEEPLQALLQREVIEEPDEVVQPSADHGLGTGTATTAAQQAVAAPGPGRGMLPTTRGALEPSMGVDLTGVRIHEGHRAADAARSIGARAFTHGSDIWLGSGESQQDLGLMAHEATHVAQQAGGLQRDVIQRAAEPGTDAEPKTEVTERFDRSNRGTIDTRKQHIQIDKIKIPRFKVEGTKSGMQLSAQALRERAEEAGGEAPAGGGLRIPTDDRDTQQIRVWETAVRTKAAPHLETKLAAQQPVTVPEGPGAFYLRSRSGNLLMGTPDDITARILRPNWNQRGKYAPHDVDHIHEIQLGGLDVVENMWLLEASANRSSGVRIRNEIRRTVTAFLGVAAPHLVSEAPRDVEQALDKHYTIGFERPVGGLEVSGQPGVRWERKDIEGGAQLGSFTVLDEDAIKEAGLVGKPGEVALFVAPTGGKVTKIEIAEGEASGLDQPWPGTSSNLRITRVVYDAASDQEGRKEVTLVGFRDSKLLKSFEVQAPVQPIPGVQYGGFVSTWGVRKQINEQLKQNGFPELSPVELETLDLHGENGIVARGRVLPTVPIFRDVAIDIVLDGQDIYLSKLFTADDFDLPGPVRVIGPTLEIQLGTQGLRFLGEAPFEIERLGSGRITGEAGVSGAGTGVALGGEFDFDPTLFDPARIEVWYRDGRFGGSGELGIEKGTVPGIESARAAVTIDEERIEAEGDVVVSVPGIQDGAIRLTYDAETGLLVAGTLNLSPDVPGLRSGRLEVTVREKEEGGYALGGAIFAEPDLPGVTGAVTGVYDDGAWLVQGMLGYSKGMLAGSLVVGATNRALDDDGEPTGEPTPSVVAFGEGIVTVQLTPWLQGTVGLSLRPNGELLVSGEVALPDALELFPEKKLEKNIFTINLDIPIVGFTVLRQRVGIFATVGGGLDASAGIGPGQLRELGIRVQYNPDREEETEITGGAQLYIPAHAGLRLFVRGGLGAGIPLVSATARLELGGALGIQGALTAGAELEWTPASGLVLDALVELSAQPSFRFDVLGAVDVVFDYAFGSKTLYDRTWDLASVEYGSDMQFGIAYPFHYVEGRPFDVSLNDIEFTYPRIDSSQLLKGLVSNIV